MVRSVTGGLDSQLLEEHCHQSHVPKAVSGAAAKELVAIDSQMERIDSPRCWISWDHIHVAADEGHNGPSTLPG